MKKFYSLIFIISLAASTCFADEFDNISIDEVRKIENRLTHFNKEEKTNEVKQKYRNLEIDRYSLENIRKSGFFRALLNAGTTIVDIDTNKPYKIPRHIYVHLFRKVDAQGRRYIINKKGLISHYVRSEDVMSVEKWNANLYEAPFHYKPVETITSKKFYDEDGYWVVGGSIYTGLFLPQFTKDLANDEESTYGSGFKGEVNTLFQFKLPHQFGLSAQLETYTMDLSDGGTINSSSWSIGPIFKSKVIQFFASDVHLMAQYRWSVNGEVTMKREDTTYLYDYTSNFLQVGILSTSEKMSYGSYSWGAHFQRQWIRASAKQYRLETNPKNTFDDAFFVSLLIQKDFSWPL